MDNALKLRVVFDMIDNMTKPLKNILAGSKGLAGSLKETRRELADMGKTQKTIGEFREMRGGLSATAAKLNAARGRVAELAQQMRATDTPSRQMTRDFEKAKQAAALLGTEHERQRMRVQELRQQLTGAGINTSDLSRHERELRTNMAATTATMNEQMRKLDAMAVREKRVAAVRERMEKMKALAGSMAGAGAKMMASGAVTGAVTLAPVAAYAAAEDSATQLASALMRAGGVVPPEFEKINLVARKLGDRLPGTTADFQDMMAMLTRQGISAQAILGGMGEATAYLGVQLKKSPAEAAEFTAKLQDATRTTERDMLSLTDVIQKAFMLGVDDNNMLQGFAKLGPAMDAIRMKGLEGAKALAPLLVMADQSGMEGSAAGNAYRKVFQLGMDTKRVDRANKQLAPAQRLNFTNGKGEFGGLNNMFAQLQKLKGLTTQKRLGVVKEIFGDDAETLQVISLMIEKGKAGYDEVQAKMAAQASMQERVNKQLGTLKNLWEAAGGTFTNGLAAFGEAISPEVKSVVDWLGNMAQRMSEFARENPRLANGLMKSVAAFAILMTALGGLTIGLAGVLGPMAVLKFSISTLGMQGGILARVLGIGAGAFRMLGSAIMFVGRMMLTNPIGLAITAIALGAYLIYRYWEPIKAFFGGLWEGVCATFAGAMAWFSTLPAQFAAFGSNIISGLVNGITGGLGTVKEAIVNVASSTVGWFKEKLGIHSPSRVFAELGGFVAHGAAIGMDGGRDRVAKAAATLATVATTAFGVPQLAHATQAATAPLVRSTVPIDTRRPLVAAPTATAAAATDPRQYVINIYPQGNSDPQAIARAVTAELDRRERAQRARRASSLSDS